MTIRKKNIFDPSSQNPFALSRSKLNSFLECPRCFYLDRRLGVSPPPGFPFNINSAVDELLKKEFDEFRELGKPHPYIEQAGINAIPYSHPDLDIWRQNFKGVRYLHKPSGFEVFGAVDDIWIDLDTDELIVVDYKATSKNGEVGINAGWQRGYRRQMDFYQWLLRQLGFKVSSTGYFVYCNGDRARPAFEGAVHFKVSVLSYVGSNDWIEGALIAARDTLCSSDLPDANPDCEYCIYVSDLDSVIPE